MILCLALDLYSSGALMQKEQLVLRTAMIANEIEDYLKYARDHSPYMPLRLM